METDEELFRLVDECSNWGRWGDDDELGTLNYITDSKRAAAAGLVVTGRAFSIGKDLSTVASAANTGTDPGEAVFAPFGGGVARFSRGTSRPKRRAICGPRVGG